jgi:hypothetical protein
MAYMGIPIGLDLGRRDEGAGRRVQEALTPYSRLAHVREFTDRIDHVFGVAT